VKLFFVLAAFFLLSFSVNSQLVLDTVEAQYLVAYNFFGADYEVSNVVVVGDPVAFAQFDGTNTNLGLNKGVMIATGDCSIGFGPNQESNESTDIVYNHSPGKLIFASNGVAPLKDVAYIEFDLVPFADSLVFKYVFASEEYKEFVGSSFNDVVGILIEGPGIQSLEDLAVLPNGDKVTIHNIHGPVSNQFGTFPPENSNYYVDNVPFVSNTDSTEIGYDGFTKETVARISNLQIGETYRITIGVADGVDGLYDSALFIEACESCNYVLGNQDQIIAKFSIAPNPAHDEISISATGVHQYQIFDLLGHVLGSGSFQDYEKVDIQSLKAGTYFILFDSGATQKFVKQ